MSGGWRALAGVVLLGVLICAPAQAHKPSDSYLALTVPAAAADARFDGQWDIALRDLDFAIGLDANGDGEITWGELRARHADIAAYALARLTVQADGTPCAIEAGEQLVDRHTDGAYTVLPLRVACVQAPIVLSLGYRLFADIDPQHRGLLRLQTARRHAHRGARPADTDAGLHAGAVEPLATVSGLRRRRRVAHLDRLRPHPVPAVAAAAGGAGVAQAALGAGGTLRAGLLGRAEDRHRLHAGAFDHLVAGHAGRAQPAFACRSNRRSPRRWCWRR